MTLTMNLCLASLIVALCCFLQGVTMVLRCGTGCFYISLEGAKKTKRLLSKINEPTVCKT